MAKVGLAATNQLWHERIARAVGLLRRFIPLLVPLAVIATGVASMIGTASGHIPDIWSHISRIDGIVNVAVLVYWQRFFTFVTDVAAVPLLYDTDHR